MLAETICPGISRVEFPTPSNDGFAKIPVAWDTEASTDE